jgi:hypothetical protein
MKDRIVSFKTAKLAKEKGFNESCDNWWVETLEHELDIPRSGIELFPAMEPRILGHKPLEDYHIIHGPAPSQSLLKKWLREKHNIEVEPYRTGTYEEGNPDAKLYGCEGENWNGETEEEFDLFNVYDNEYEDVLEKGLYLALKSIKINEEKNESKNNK